MTGQCRICGELITPPGQVMGAPEPRQAEFALLAVGAFFHIMQRHPEVAKGAIEILMGSVSQYASILCVDTAAEDHESLLAKMRADLAGMIEHARFSPLQKTILVQPYAVSADGAKAGESGAA